MPFYRSKSKNTTHGNSMGFLAWFLTILVFLIPYLNILMVIIWSIKSRYTVRRWFSRFSLVVVIVYLFSSNTINLDTLNAVKGKITEYDFTGTSISTFISPPEQSTTYNNTSVNDNTSVNENNPIFKNDTSTLITQPYPLKYEQEVPKTEEELPRYLFDTYTTLVSYIDYLNSIGSAYNYGSINYRDTIGTVTTYYDILSDNLGVLKSIHSDRVTSEKNRVLLYHLKTTHYSVTTDLESIIKNQSIENLYGYTIKFDTNLTTIENALRE